MSAKRFRLSLSLVLALILVSALFVPALAEGFAPIAKEELKVGMVLIGSQDDGFSGAHYNGLEGMKKELGLTDSQVLYKFNVPETAECDAASGSWWMPAARSSSATPGVL